LSHLEGLGFIFPPQVTAQAKLGATSSQGHGLRITGRITVATAINVFCAGGLPGQTAVIPMDREGAGEGEAIANLLGVS
jgi:hypothetical protein